MITVEAVLGVAGGVCKKRNGGLDRVKRTCSGRMGGKKSDKEVGGKRDFLILFQVEVDVQSRAMVESCPCSGHQGLRSCGRGNSSLQCWLGSLTGMLTLPKITVYVSMEKKKL